MKIFVIALLLFIWQGQTQAQTSTTTFPPPDYYIDSVKIGFPLTWMNPQNIAAISVSQGNETHPNGSIYLTWKTPHPVFFSLADVSDADPTLKGKPIFYIIDDSLISDTTNVRIEAANIFQVHRLDSPHVRYLPKDTGPLTLVLIETFASFHKQEPPKGQGPIIHLR
jgi:hypothetical protein